MAARTKSRPGVATPEEAAAYLGVAKQTLNNWRHLGKGPAYVKRSNKYVRYRWAALDAWLDENP